MRLWVLALFLGVPLLAACDPGIGITFENRTDSLICVNPRETDEGPTGPCDEIEPRETVTYGMLCRSDDEESVVLTDGVGGAVIYRRTATCGEWEDSGATITIDWDGDNFVVTDSFSD